MDREHEREALPRRKLDIAFASPEHGLTQAQVQERRAAGLENAEIEPPTKTVKQIILGNTLTYFNLVFCVLAVFVIIAGKWNDLTFMGVVFANAFIGIVQELRSKRTLDKLNLLSTPKAVVIRDGERREINVHNAVRDDIAVFSVGNQIYADGEVVAGECSVNEALITGEADEIKKRPGDPLLSGSFVVSGSCRARLTNVGAESYASKITLEAKKSKNRGKSEMMSALTKLVKWIGIIMIPLGGIMAVKEMLWLHRSVSDGIISTVAALVGMIPEGLYLLTSLALVASVLRLGQRKTLVHEMSCIEALARVDTLCVDKTGTITENKMIVEDIALLCEDRFIKDDIRMIMADYVFAMQDDNDTMAALRRYFSGQVNQTAEKTMAFTSAKKYGGVSFHEDETYLLGAPDVILGSRYEEYREQVELYSGKGCRVLLLTLYDGDLEDERLTAEMMPLALILLANKIRQEAPDTFRFFAEQGVEIKVISGDNAMTVSEVAKRAEIQGAEKYVDARTLDTDQKIREAAVEYTVFGRVTPDQKKKLVRALRAAGRTVAMTGDGVNDVLALKEADCSVAMASGSDVACHASHIVLMDSNFASMPSVVMEGRRVINNIERSASLYLTKNIFSFLLALISLCFTLPYPFSPSQLTLVSALTIGAPSFVLAMEPNESLIRGKFLLNVLRRALPAALTDLIMIVGVLLFYLAFDLDEAAMSTICAIVMCTVGMVMLYDTSVPFNGIRKLLFGAMTAALLFCIFALRDLFDISPLKYSEVLILVVFALLSIPGFQLLKKWLAKMEDFIAQHIKPRKKRRAG